jgi:hypothetical protein
LSDSQVRYIILEREDSTCEVRPTAKHGWNWVSIVYNKKEDAEKTAEFLNELIKQGFVSGVRGGLSVMKKTIYRREEPKGGENGFVQVVIYHPFPGEIGVSKILVECPSRRTLMFRLETIKEFDIREEKEAIEFAKNNKIYFKGKLYSPGEVSEIERLGL